MARGVAIHRRPDCLILCPISEAERGAGLLTEPVIRLSPGASPGELGCGVLELLPRCRTGLPMPRSQSQAVKPLLRAAGVRSWKQFATQTRYCDLAEVGEELEIVPTSAHRPGAPWFAHIPDESVCVLKSATPDVLGLAIHGVLERCRVL